MEDAPTHARRDSDPMPPSKSLLLNEVVQDQSPVEETKESAADLESKISKYDVLRVRVWVEDHFYVFSRFLISRILTVNAIPPKDSIRIAMDLKKLLVEEEKFDVQQGEMEDRLFNIMRTKYNYTEKYMNRYKMMNTFYHQRIPLVILISGPPLCGKSTLTTQLADLVNISNVQQTAIVTTVMQCMDSTLARRPFWAYSDPEERMDHFQQECRSARRGVTIDLQKCLTDGKGLIIEGYQVEPNLYIFEDHHVPSPQRRPDKDIKHQKKLKMKHQESEENYKEAEKKIQRDFSSIDQTKSVVVPFLLTISEKDHQYTIEKWLASCLPPDIEQELSQLGSKKDQQKHLLSTFQQIQTHLLSYSDTVNIVPVNLHNINDTINQMHDVILDRIEAAHDRGEF